MWETQAMTSVIMGQGTPVTEEEFFALGETSRRIELFDGSLFVTPARTPQHQHISSELAFALRTAARKAGLYVHEAVNVRLLPGRIPIPDVAVTEKINFKELVIDAEAVRLICEIVSPSNASADKVLKMHYYAAAGIPWYLLVEQESATLHLYQLRGDHYVEHSVTRPGEVLHLEEPVTADLVPEDLLPPD
ncbi:Uma2 family endonuclease [Actinoplanes sp. NPDC048967]|uniref:Uma2 family endonuclease n=1 Tax=Actinoplanes sp. NPDC048967 TaxID=3155269 RepID=UPI0033F2178E